MLLRFLSWVFGSRPKPRKQKEQPFPFIRISIWAIVYNIGTREHPIHSHYTPTWDLGDTISGTHSARILFDDINWRADERINFRLQSNENHFAILAPLAPYYWQHLMPGDTIKGYEGTKQTCYAVIEQVIIDGDYKAIKV